MSAFQACVYKKSHKILNNRKKNIEKSVKNGLKCICELCYASASEKQLIYHSEKLNDLKKES